MRTLFTPLDGTPPFGAESIPQGLEGPALEAWLRETGYELRYSQILRLTPARWRQIAERLTRELKEAAKAGEEKSGNGASGQEKTYVFTLLDFCLSDPSIPGDPRS